MSIPTPLRRFLELPESLRRLGHYHLVEVLGHGGFAPVWLAKEIHGGQVIQKVAVKLFWFDPATAGAKRVHDEAMALCRVQHASIVRYLTLVTGQTDQSRGVLGLVMEYVEGTPLHVRLHQAGTLPPSETMKIGAAVARALSAAHRAGLVHRDVKPGNILLSGKEYKLIDFGIAAAEQEGRRSRTSVYEGIPVEPSITSTSETGPARTSSAPVSTGAGRSAPIFAGTLGYADPTVVRGERHATAASDIYSLGATLFECLVGRVPASAKGALDSGVLQGSIPPPSLRDLDKAVSRELSALVERMLAPEPEDRPFSAEWVAAELDRLRGLREVSSRTIPLEETGPFRDLQCFEVKDRDVYFGRAGEIATALDLLRTSGLVALIGPSGSGKSSLARAGVLAVAETEGIGQWPPVWDTAIAIAGQETKKSIQEALQRLDPPVEDAAAMTPLGLVDLLSERVQRSSRGVLLLVDQLEQIASPSVPESESKWTSDFLALLGEKPPPGVRAIVTVRRDLLDGVLGLSRMGKVIVRGSLLVAPISAVVWEEVIDQALSVYDYGFEDDGLRREILGEIQESAQAMPLIQFALTLLWGKRDRAAKKITRQGYTEIGGLAGALKRHAEDALKTFLDESKMSRRVARKVLLELTTPEGTRRSRLRASLCEGEPGADSLLRALEQKRLIVSDGEHVTLAHDALITRWETLARWVDDERVDRILMENLERDAKRYLKDPTAPLWTRRYIYLADHVIARGIFPISPEAMDYLRVSRRADLRVRRGVIAVVCLALGLAVVLVVRERQRREVAEKQRVELAIAWERAEAERRRVEAAKNELRDATGQLLKASNEILFAQERERKNTEFIQQSNAELERSKHQISAQREALKKAEDKVQEVLKRTSDGSEDLPNSTNPAVREQPSPTKGPR